MKLMVASGHGLIVDVKHFKEEAQILDIIRIIIVVDVEPKNSVRVRMYISHGTHGFSRRNKNG